MCYTLHRCGARILERVARVKRCESALLGLVYRLREGARVQSPFGILAGRHTRYIIAVRVLLVVREGVPCGAVPSRAARARQHALSQASQPIRSAGDDGEVRLSRPLSREAPSGTCCRRGPSPTLYECYTSTACCVEQGGQCGDDLGDADGHRHSGGNGDAAHGSGRPVWRSVR
jgi:hypothetical protein